MEMDWAYSYILRAIGPDFLVVVESLISLFIKLLIIIFLNTVQSTCL